MLDEYDVEKATLDYLVADLSLNKMNKKECLDHCVAERVNMLSDSYNSKIDKILTFMILKCNFEDLPVKQIIQITSSMNKIVNILNKGFLQFLD